MSSMQSRAQAAQMPFASGDRIQLAGVSGRGLSGLEGMAAALTNGPFWLRSSLTLGLGLIGMFRRGGNATAKKALTGVAGPDLFAAIPWHPRQLVRRRIRPRPVGIERLRSR